MAKSFYDKLLVDIISLATVWILSGIFIFTYPQNLEITTSRKIISTADMHFNGEIKNIKICPADPNLISFEGYKGIDKVELFYVFANKKESLPVKIQLSSNESNFMSSRVDQELDWCPVKINDEYWFVFESTYNGNEDLFLGNTSGKYFVQLTGNIGQDYHPRWSPDGSKIVFVSSRKGNADIYLLNNVKDIIDKYGEEINDGTLPKNSRILKLNINKNYFEDLTAGNLLIDTNPDWSPDGNYIVYQRQTITPHNKNKYFQLALLDMEHIGSSKVKIIERSSSTEDILQPGWSPIIDSSGYKIAFYTVKDNSISTGGRNVRLNVLTINSNNYSFENGIADYIKKSSNFVPCWAGIAQGLIYVKSDGIKTSIDYVSTKRLNNNYENVTLLRDNPGTTYQEVNCIRYNNYSIIYYLTYQDQQYNIYYSLLLDYNSGSSVNDNTLNNNGNTNMLSLGMNTITTSYSGDAPGSSLDFGTSFTMEYFFLSFNQNKFKISAALSAGLAYVSDKIVKHHPVNFMDFTATLYYNLNSWDIFFTTGPGLYADKGTSHYTLGLGVKFNIIRQMSLKVFYYHDSIGYNIDGSASPLYRKNDAYSGIQFGVYYNISLTGD